MEIRLIKKTKGHTEKFNVRKLQGSIASAMKHADVYEKELAQRLAHEALEYLEGQGKEIIDADAVRQAVLHVMTHDGQRRAAEAYELTSLHLGKVKIQEVIKRGGGKQLFHAHKIFKSLKKSFADAGLDGIKVSEEITKKIVSELEAKYAHKPVPVEEIRNLAAQLLVQKGFKKVEKLYLLHKYL